MPITFDPSNISFVTDSNDSVSVAIDRPVRPDDLEMMGVGEDYLAAVGFEATLGQTAALPESGPVVLAVGLGADPLTVAGVRKVAGSVAKAAAKLDSLTITSAAAVAEELGADVAAQAVVEGVLLASYRFDELKGDPEEAPSLASISVVVPDGTDTETVLSRATAVARGIGLARDLVNKPGGSLTAVDLAEVARSVAQEHGLGLDIWDRDRLVEEKCGGILGVNAGSTEEPRLIRLTYVPEADATAEIHIVGKGITFDTGGLNLKPFEGMQTMKIDMGGAAAVIGAMEAVSALAPSVRIVATCCCTDNQPGPTATKPGDVLTIRNGTTVEVLNTDAEGRLVLADGLSLAAEAEPDLVIDLATLTGACMVALGEKYGGVMGNDEAAVQRITDGAEAAGELMWQLPLPKEYRKQLDSDVADLRNIGAGRMGGALTAGLFLQEFAGEGPWVHLDIAGPVTGDDASGEFSKGATGFAVRTLLEVISAY